MGKTVRRSVDDKSRSRAGTAAVVDGSPPADGAVTVTLRVRPLGRPREMEQPGTSLSTWVPVTTYDRLVALAARRHQSVSSYVREVLVILTGTVVR